jgi:hypothetical protein
MKKSIFAAVVRYFCVITLACALAGAGSNCLWAQNTTTFGNITTGSGMCGAANCVYYQLPPNTPYVVVTLSGTWSGTIAFQSISAPNANYSNLNQVTWTNVATETGNGTWSVATGGATFLLAQASAWTSGTAVVNMSGSQTGSPLSNPVFPGSITAAGLTAPGGGSSSNCWTTAGGTTNCSGSSIVPSPQLQIPYFSSPGTASGLTGDPDFTTNGTGTVSMTQTNSGKYEIECGGSIGYGPLAQLVSSVIEDFNPCGAGILFFPEGALDAGAAVSMTTTDNDGVTGQPELEVSRFSNSAAQVNLAGLLVKPSYSNSLSLPGTGGMEVDETAAPVTVNAMIGMGGGTGYTCSSASASITGGTLASGSAPSCTVTCPGGVVTLSCSGSGLYTTSPSVVITGVSGGQFANLSGSPTFPEGLTVTGGVYVDPTGGFNFSHAAQKAWTSTAQNVATVTPAGEGVFSAVDIAGAAAGSIAKGDGTGVYNNPFASGPAMLPIDAEIAPGVPLGQLATSGYTGAVFFGSSLSFGEGATSCTSAPATGNCAVNLVANAIGAGSTFTNFGVDGYQWADVTDTIFNDTASDISATIPSFGEAGTNDAAKGLGPYEYVMKLAHKAGVSWRATLPANKVSGCPGSPANTSSYTAFAAVTGCQTTTTATSWTFTLPTSTVVGQVYELWYPVIDGNGGYGTWSMSDGTSGYFNNSTCPGTFSPTPPAGMCVQTNASFGNNTKTVGVVFLVNTSRAAGSYTLTVTNSSPTAAGNVFATLGAGMVAATGGPVFHDWSGLREPYDAQSYITSQMQTDMLEDDYWMQAYGLNVFFHDTRPCYFATTAEQNTSVGHPNGTVGYPEIANCILAPAATIQFPIAKGNQAGNPTRRGSLASTKAGYTADLSYNFSNGATLELDAGVKSVEIQGSTAGTVDLPLADVDQEQEIDIMNTGSSTVTLAGQANISQSDAIGKFIWPGQNATVKLTSGNRWVMKSITTTNTTQPAGYQTVSGTATLTCPGGLVDSQASSTYTLTVPNTCLGTNVWTVTNQNAAAFINVTATGGGNASGAVICPNSGAIITSFGGTSAYISTPPCSTSTTLSGTAPSIKGYLPLQTLTLSGNTTATSASLWAGQAVTMQICQPASGGPFTFAWPAAFLNGMTIGTATSACSVQSFYNFNGTQFAALDQGSVNGVATGSGPTIQTIGTNNGSQTTLNFVASSTNAAGLTATPGNPGAGANEAIEIAGTYSGTISQSQVEAAVGPWRISGIVSNTGSTSSTQVGSIQIPAGVMGTNSVLEVNWATDACTSTSGVPNASCTGTANTGTCTYVVKLSAANTGGTTVNTGPAVTIAKSSTNHTFIQNVASLSAQISQTATQYVSTSGGGSTSTAAINTASTFYINLYAQNSVSGDVCFIDNAVAALAP